MKTFSSVIESITARRITKRGALRASMVTKNQPLHKTGGAKRRDWSYRAQKPTPCVVTKF
jgi:hypothetical protein